MRIRRGIPDAPSDAGGKRRRARRPNGIRPIGAAPGLPGAGEPKVVQMTGGTGVLNRLAVRVAAVMRSERADRYGCLPVGLRMLSYGYAGVVRWRLWMYRHRLFRSRRLPCPVISIGNLTTGGTGKTPMAIYLADLLSRQGWRPMIVSR